MVLPERRLTAQDVAQIWGCSDQHVYDLCKAGELNHVRIGRLIRIRRQDVEDYERGVECRDSSSSEMSGTSPTPKTDVASVVRAVRLTSLRP